MIADRVQETSVTSGTGTLSLAGAATGRRTFVSAFGSGATVRYKIENSDGTVWEIGEGVVTSGTPDTLTRASVIRSSNLNALVNLDATSKNVVVAIDSDLVRFGVPQRPALGGTADTRTLTHVPAIAKLRNGMRVKAVNGAAANATTTPTLNVDTLGAKTIVASDGTALRPGEMAASVPVEFEYDLANDRWLLVSCPRLGQLATLDQVSLGRRNFLINGDFSWWQRGVSFTAINAYTADRWRTYGGPLAMTLSRQDSLATYSPARFAARLQRNAAETLTNQIGLAQGIVSADSYALRGQNVTLSFRALRGANFSGASNQIRARLYWGTGTDENPISMTGQTSALSQAVTLNTTLTDYFCTAAIPSNATQVTVAFEYTPAGTAGAADYFEVTDVQLERGLMTAMPTFDRLAEAAQAALCRVFYRKSFERGTAPVQNAGTAGSGGETSWFNIAAGAASNVGQQVVFDPPMRAAPTVTLFNPAAANAQPRDLTAAADWSATSAQNINTRAFRVLGTQPAGSSATGHSAVHWTAEAEL